MADITIEDVLNFLVATGVSVEDIQEAAEALEAPKKSGGKRGAKKEEEKPARGGKSSGGKRGAKKEEPAADDLIADLSVDDLIDVALELELGKEAKLKKLDRDDLEALFDDVDPEELEDAIKEVTGDGDDDDKKDDADPEYDDMSSDELIAEYVKRKLGSKKEAKDLSDDDLIEALEDDDDA